PARRPGRRPRPRRRPGRRPSRTRPTAVRTRGRAAPRRPTWRAPGPRAASPAGPSPHPAVPGRPASCVPRGVIPLTPRRHQPARSLRRVRHRAGRPGSAGTLGEPRRPSGREQMTTASQGSPARADSTDTVANAAATPDVQLPYAELGLKPDEYERIVDLLGRRPTAAELAMYSVMWSEHCSYKSSKIHLRKFGEATTDEMRRRLLVGIGQNAGVVDIGDGWAVTFKVES